MGTKLVRYISTNSHNAMIVGKYICYDTYIRRNADDFGVQAYENIQVQLGQILTKINHKSNGQWC